MQAILTHLVWVLVDIKEFQEMSNKLTVEEVVRGIYCSQAPVGIVGRVWTETEIPSCKKNKIHWIGTSLT